jgi:NADH-quinone oxidoreductase subunit M
MAKGRPILVTIVLTAGMMTLAVPGSATFAGEFLIMAGVYGQGWGYTAIVALGVVLAAMYTLRLISAILHDRSGAGERQEALDLRAGELGLVVPLVLVLLALSAWPAAISDRAVNTTDYVAFFRPQDVP